MRTPGRFGQAVIATGAVALIVIGSGVAAVAGPAAGSPPGAALCVAEGQPALTARPDGSGGFVCGSGRTLAVVAADDAVRLLDAAVGDLQGSVGDLQSSVASLRSSVTSLQGQLDALRRATDVTTRTTPVPFAQRADGTYETSRSWMSCGSSGKALSGSAQVANASLVQSYVTDAGRGWYFEIRPTGGTAPSATTYLVCAGAGSGGNAPVPGGATPGG